MAKTLRTWTCAYMQWQGVGDKFRGSWDVTYEIQGSA